MIFMSLDAKAIRQIIANHYAIGVDDVCLYHEPNIVKKGDDKVSEWSVFAIIEAVEKEEANNMWVVIYTDGTTATFDGIQLDLLNEYLDASKQVLSITRIPSHGEKEKIDESVQV